MSLNPGQWKGTETPERPVHAEAEGSLASNRGHVSSWLFPADARTRARRDRILALCFLVLGVVLVARAARKEAGVLVHNQEWGARFLAREDPYFDPAEGRRIHGPYPPSLALMAAPLSVLPTRVARVCWSSAQVVALWVFFLLFRARIRRHWPELAPHASVLFALALLLVSRYLLRDTAGGGGNLLYSLLALSGVELALDVRGGRAGLAGLPLALSLVLKPNLWPLFWLLALRARWRAVASTLGAGVLLFSLPGFYFGPRAYADLTRRWASDVVSYGSLDDLHARDLVPDGLPSAKEGMNQSLRESVYRLLRPPGDSGADDVHLLSVSPEVALWVGRVLGLALLLLASSTAWRARGELGEWLAVLAFLPLALLLSPVTWKAHHVDLLPSFGGLLALAAAEVKVRRWLGPLLAFYWLVCDLFADEIVGSTFRDFLQTLSIVAWMDVVLLLVLLRFVVRPARA